MLIHTVKKAPLAAMLLALLVVTAAREIAFFTSFAGSAADNGLAVAFALALVIAKPLMAGAAGQQWAANNKPLAVMCWLIVLPLLGLSVASTAAYFESAYQVQASAEQQSSASYRNTTALIASKLQTADQLKRTATEAERAGNSWNAGELLRESRAIETEVQALQATLQTLPAVATGAATVSGNSLGSYRWLAWAGLAVLADLLQLVAVVLLDDKNSTRTERQKQNKTAERKQAEQPEQNIKQNSEQKTQTQTTAPEKTAGDWLAEQISQNGKLPTVRDAKAAGVTYASYTAQVQQLLADGIIEAKASGKGWEVRGA